MLKDIVEARPLEGHRIFLRFEDGAAGEVDLSKLVEFTGVFAALRDPGEFRKVIVHPELGTICWPNGADVDTDVLYSQVTGQAIVMRGTQPPPQAGAWNPTMETDTTANKRQNAPYLVFVLLLSIYAVVALALTTFFKLPPPTRSILGYADTAVCVLFFLDFLITLARAPNRGRYLVTWGWTSSRASLRSMLFGGGELRAYSAFSESFAASRRRRCSASSSSIDVRRAPSWLRFLSQSL